MSSVKICTKFTKALGLLSPIVLAPMYYAATPVMAARVTSAGGLGFIAAGFESSDTLREYFRSMREELKISADSPIPIGVGLLGWILDSTESDTSTDKRIPTVLAEKPKAIWFAFGEDVGKYVRQVREYEKDSKDHQTLVFVIVNTVEEARRAATEWKGDVLVVQGYESGGHGTSNSPPASLLLSAVIQELQHPRPLILAAGGISTGQQIASFLLLGADGVAIGSRFLLTEECMYTNQMKDLLIKLPLDASSTVRSYAFDDVHPVGTNWPKGIDGRAISNKIVEDYNNHVDLNERKKRAEQGRNKGDGDYLSVWTGMGIGLVKDIKNTSDVMKELQEQTYATLKSAADFII